MTAAEWARFTARLEMAFRGGLEDDREAELQRHFGRVRLVDAEACLDRLVREGQVFMPTPGELVQQLRRIRSYAPLELALAGLDQQQVLAHFDAESRRYLDRIESRTALPEAAGRPRRQQQGLPEQADTTRGEPHADEGTPAPRA